MLTRQNAGERIAPYNQFTPRTCCIRGGASSTLQPIHPAYLLYPPPPAGSSQANRASRKIYGQCPARPLFCFDMIKPHVLIIKTQQIYDVVIADRPRLELKQSRFDNLQYVDQRGGGLSKSINAGPRFGSVAPIIYQVLLY